MASPLRPSWLYMFVWGVWGTYLLFTYICSEIVSTTQSSTFRRPSLPYHLSWRHQVFRVHVLSPSALVLPERLNILACSHARRVKSLFPSNASMGKLVQTLGIKKKDDDASKAAGAVGSRMPPLPMLSYRSPCASDWGHCASYICAGLCPAGIERSHKRLCQNGRCRTEGRVSCMGIFPTLCLFHGSKAVPNLSLDEIL